MPPKKNTLPKNGATKPKPAVKKTPPKKGFQLGVRLKEEIAGLSLIAGAVCLILSIASHETAEQADNIWEQYQKGQLQNALGLIGAYLSYFLVSNTFGYAVIAFPVLMLAYGWLLLTHRSVFTVNAFAFYLMTLMVLVSVWFALPATLAQKDSWALSGLIGGIIAKQLYQLTGGFGFAAIWVTLSLLWIVMATRISIADLIPIIRNAFISLFRKTGESVRRFRERQKELKEANAENDHAETDEIIEMPEADQPVRTKDKPLIPEYLQKKKPDVAKEQEPVEEKPVQTSDEDKKKPVMPPVQGDFREDAKKTAMEPAELTMVSVNDRYDTALINDLKALEQITSSISLPDIDFEALKKKNISGDDNPPEKKSDPKEQDAEIRNDAIPVIANEDVSVKKIDKKEIEISQTGISDIAKDIFDEEHAQLDLNSQQTKQPEVSVFPEKTDTESFQPTKLPALSFDINDTDKSDLKPVPETTDEKPEARSVESVQHKPAMSQSEIKKIDYDKENQAARSRYKYPSLDLLEMTNETEKLSEEDIAILDQKIHQIIGTLAEFGIDTKVVATEYGGPVVAIYQLELPSGLKISKITGLEDELALSMKVKSVRIIPVTAKGTIQVEIPKPKPSPVLIRSLFEDKSFRQSKHKYKLGLALGKDIDGTIHFEDLAKMPHLLIAGTTGSGKSVGINSVLTSLLYQFDPSEVKLVLIDPKKVELALYRKLKNHHLICLRNSSGDLIEDVITKPDNAKQILKALVEEMEWRYELLAHANVRNIEDYNKRWQEGDLPEDGKYELCKLEYIITIIDELADLMMTAPREVETSITRLAQMARAVGIHLIVATQRPSVDVLTGLIKANFPARIAYQVRSKIDSRTILDMSGAELLLGKGDMLYLPPGHMPTRIQNAFTSTKETEQIVDFISRMPAFPRKDFFIREETKDENGGEGFSDDYDSLFNDALEIVVKHNQGSASLLQRRLSIGYARAARIIDQLERNGIVSAQDGGKPRQVLIDESDITGYKI